MHLNRLKKKKPRRHVEVCFFITCWFDLFLNSFLFFENQCDIYYHLSAKLSKTFIESQLKQAKKANTYVNVCKTEQANSLCKYRLQENYYASCHPVKQGIFCDSKKENTSRYTPILKTKRLTFGCYFLVFIL